MQRFPSMKSNPAFFDLVTHITLAVHLPTAHSIGAHTNGGYVRLTKCSISISQA